VFLLVFYNTYQGVLNAPANLIRLVRVLGASEHQVWTKVILPSASPWIITGLRISVPQALVGAVVGEFIAASQGLGYVIQFQSSLFNTTGAMGGIAIMAFVVVVINDLLDRVERRLMRWRPKETAATVAES
jgi:NitT/TauT family transport system permease protein